MTADGSGGSSGGGTDKGGGSGGRSSGSGKDHSNNKRSGKRARCWHGRCQCSPYGSRSALAAAGAGLIAYSARRTALEKRHRQ